MAWAIQHQDQRVRALVREMEKQQAWILLVEAKLAAIKKRLDQGGYSPPKAGYPAASYHHTRRTP
jgi:hypothetical protein